MSAPLLLPVLLLAFCRRGGGGPAAVRHRAAGVRGRARRPCPRARGEAQECGGRGGRCAAAPLCFSRRFGPPRRRRRASPPAPPQLSSSC
eukprot:2983772-Pyramimonas_sp.AAC.1